MWIAGWRGILHGASGRGVGLAILLPLVLLRALGAGDWKLMGAAEPSSDRSCCFLCCWPAS